MHLIAFILYFVCGSINAAFHQDYSGIEAIGKFILFVALFFIMAFILTNPILLVIIIRVLVLIGIGCSKA